VGARFKARIREVVEKGNTPLAAGTMILSLGADVASRAPTVKAGDVIEISLATLPEMTGARTAMGGGPRLVADGKPVNGWRSPNDRHPRTAIGWNDDHLFLILVDGRQPGLSVGMSLTELANYFVKIGCKTAVNLDGGGSASMWLLGQTVSSPSEGRERPVANGVVIVKKHREAAQIND
jgi:exopolysaccharide biosynthesis protein